VLQPHCRLRTTTRSISSAAMWKLSLDELARSPRHRRESPFAPPAGLTWSQP
jgi:hypothetical protein